MEEELEEPAASPEVPTDLLELSVELQMAEVSPEEFKEAFDGQTGEES